MRMIKNALFSEEIAIDSERNGKVDKSPKVDRSIVRLNIRISWHFVVSKKEDGWIP
mgnify:CR=1 FL=1